MVDKKTLVVYPQMNDGTPDLNCGADIFKDSNIDSEEWKENLSTLDRINVDKLLKSTSFKYVWILDYSDGQAYCFSLPPALYTAGSEKLEDYISQFLLFSLGNISWMLSNNINSKMSK